MAEQPSPSRFLDAVVDAARDTLPDEVFGYFRQGAAGGVTAAEAVAAWDRFRLVPRVLRDVTRVEVSRSLLGTDVASPFGIAPTTLQRAAHPDGEVATARAAAAEGALMVVASNAGSRFEDIAATGVSWWLQIYVTSDRTRIVPVVERAVTAGARAVVLTADTPVVATSAAGSRSVWDAVDPRWLRVNFDEDPGDSAVQEKAMDLGPQDVAWLADRFAVPVVVKGVLHAADARRCVDAGASAVWVSNHGGRQLDHAVATAEVLGDVAAAVGSDVEVYADGGVRRGSHAMIAGALGADAVFLGRPVLYGLAASGDDGVRRVLHDLRVELIEALRLAGQPSFGGLGRDVLRMGAAGPHSG